MTSETQKGARRGLNLHQRMVLWFTGIILALLACVLAFLHLRVTDETRAQVYLELDRTRMMFENIHRLRGEDLLRQCRLVASAPWLSGPVSRGAAREVAAVVAERAATLGADEVLVMDRRGVILAQWPPPSPGQRRSRLAESVRCAALCDGPEQAGVAVSSSTIYQTACCPIRHPASSARMGVLVLGNRISDYFALRLKAMSGAEITFFAGLAQPTSGRRRSTIVASTLPSESQTLLHAHLAATDRDPLYVPARGRRDPYVVDMGEGRQFLSTTAPIRDRNREVVGAYVIQRPLEDALVVVDRIQRSLVFVGLVAVLAAIGASYALANGVGRSIMGVVRAAEALSAGDWTRRVPAEGPDDIRILAEAFNRMAARLQGWDAELRAEVARRTEELNQALSRLDANLRRMRQFHADASHELRTPLTIMRGEVEVALRSVRTPEEYQRVLVSILEEMNRVSTIVDHLLLLARADSGQIHVARHLLDLNALLREIYPQALLLAERKQVVVGLEEEQERVHVVGDSGKLRQLFLNLLDNAIKYTPDGGSVRLRLSIDNGFALVSVEDTGIGIAAEDIPHIFGRFYRADRARSRDMGGTGLGLAICQWIVEAHHGWIDVQSVVGQGSTFTAYLPRVLTEALPGTGVPDEGDAETDTDEPAVATLASGAGAPISNF